MQMFCSLNRIWNLVLFSSIALAPLAVSPSGAFAGNFKFHVSNRAAAPVLVIMDTHRESYLVNPNASVVFSEANIGDNPTFRVYTPGPNGEPGALLYTDTFHTIRVFHNPTSRHLNWNGSKLDDD